MWQTKLFLGSLWFRTTLKDQAQENIFIDNGLNIHTHCISSDDVILELLELDIIFPCVCCGNVRVMSQPETVLWPAGMRSHVTSWAERQQTKLLLELGGNEGSLYKDLSRKKFCQGWFVCLLTASRPGWSTLLPSGEINLINCDNLN